jgi:hypothetical protein
MKWTLILVWVVMLDYDDSLTILILKDLIR